VVQCYKFLLSYIISRWIWILASLQLGLLLLSCDVPILLWSRISVHV